MKIRKFKEKDRNSLIEFWQRVFPDDPPHNEPSKVIESKLAIDDLIFLVESNNEIIGACMAGYDGGQSILLKV